MAMAVIRPRSSGSSFVNHSSRACLTRVGPEIGADPIFVHKTLNKGCAASFADQIGNRAAASRSPGRAASGKRHPVRKSTSLTSSAPLPTAHPAAGRQQCSRSSKVTHSSSTRTDSLTQRTSLATGGRPQRPQGSEVGRSRSCSAAGRASVSKPNRVAGDWAKPISGIARSSCASDSAASDALEVLSNFSHESDDKTAQLSMSSSLPVGGSTTVASGGHSQSRTGSKIGSPGSSKCSHDGDVGAMQTTASTRIQEAFLHVKLHELDDTCSPIPTSGSLLKACATPRTMVKTPCAASRTQLSLPSSIGGSTTPEKLGVSHDSDCIFAQLPASPSLSEIDLTGVASSTAHAQCVKGRKGIKGKLPVPPRGVDRTFEPRQWLNDESISFGSTCLSALGRSVLGGVPGSLPKTVMIMDPAMAFWLALQEDPAEVKEARKAMKLQDIELLLCPINDSNDAEQADSGLHWTLLVCWGNRGSSNGRRDCDTFADSASHLQHFRYYDSLGFGSLFSFPVHGHAKKLASRLAGRPVEVSMGSCSRQRNFYDCGVYALLLSEIIADAFLESPQLESDSNEQEPIWEERLKSVTPEDASACRLHYFNLARGGSSD